jgi:hypothetical protein
MDAASARTAEESQALSSSEDTSLATRPRWVAGSKEEWRELYQ